MKVDVKRFLLAGMIVTIFNAVYGLINWMLFKFLLEGMNDLFRDTTAHDLNLFDV